MSDPAGKFHIDGQDVAWERNPYVNGITITFGACESIHLPGEPDVSRARDALIGYRFGRQHGEHVGRAILQNEFRNLMACQPR